MCAHCLLSCCELHAQLSDDRLKAVEVMLHWPTILPSQRCCFTSVGCADRSLRLQLFQDRLEAVEVMLLQKPIVSGRYTGYAFRHFVLPLDPHFRAVWDR